MSGAPDPKPADAPEPTLVQQDGAIPETVIPQNAVDPVPDLVDPPAELIEPKAEPELKLEPKQPPKKRSTVTVSVERLNELTRRTSDAERKAAERDAELKLLKTKPGEEGAVSPAQMTQAEWDRQVAEAAQRVIQQQAIQSKSRAWLDAGIKDFGREEFDARCETLAALGGGEKPEFMAMIVDPDLIPDGHKVVAQLAEQPEEAQRILSLPPVQMAAALTRFAMTVPPEKKQVSSAPRPISPIGGSAKPSAPSESDDIKTWMEKRRKEVAAKQQRA